MPAASCAASAAMQLPMSAFQATWMQIERSSRSAGGFVYLVVAPVSLYVLREIGGGPFYCEKVGFYCWKGQRERLQSTDWRVL